MLQKRYNMMCSMYDDGGGPSGVWMVEAGVACPCGGGSSGCMKFSNRYCDCKTRLAVRRFTTLCTNTDLFLSHVDMDFISF